MIVGIGSLRGITGGSLGTLIVQIAADNRNLKSGLKDSENSVNVSAKRLAATATSVAGTLAQIGLTVTAAVGAASLKSAIDFESAFAGVRKTVNATEQEFKQLERGLIELSKTIPVSANELARIEEIAGQLGVRGTKNLTSFTKSIAQISATTNLTSDAAAFQFSRLASVIGEPIENIDKMGSAVVALGNNFEVVESEILTFALRIAAAGRNAGLTTEEILGIAAAFASVGVQAEAGGTAVNNVLLELQKEGKRGIEGFTGFVDELARSGDRAGIRLEKLGFNSARLQRAFLSVAGANGKLNETLGLSVEEFDKGSALSEEFAKRAETTASQITILKNEINALAIEIGNDLLPTFRDALKVTREFVQSLNFLRGDFALNTDSAVKVLTERIKLAEEEIRGINEGPKRGIFADDFIKREQELIKRLETDKKILADLQRNLAFQSGELPLPEPQNVVEDNQSFELDDATQQRIDKLREEQQIKEENEIRDQERHDAFQQRNRERIEAIQNEGDSLEVLAGGIVNLGNQINSSFTDALANLLSGATSAKEAVEQLGKSLIAAVARFVAEQIVANTIGSAIQAAQTAALTAMGATLTAAFAPAALAANIASFGGAAAAAAATFPIALGSFSTALAGAATTASLVNSANSGLISGAAGFARGTDNIPARLSAGEMVVPPTFADAIRAGRLTLGGPDVENFGNSGTVIERIDININGDVSEDNAALLAREIDEQISIQTEQSLRGAV